MAELAFDEKLAKAFSLSSSTFQAKIKIATSKKDIGGNSKRKGEEGLGKERSDGPGQDTGAPPETRSVATGSSEIYLPLPANPKGDLLDQLDSIRIADSSTSVKREVNIAPSASPNSEKAEISSIDAADSLHSTEDDEFNASIRHSILELSGTF
jgi:hypothetical protein